MSFQQGISGLNAASRNLEVIGNNIANAATVGAKLSRAEFAGVYANTSVQESSIASGMGVEIASVMQQFTQGPVRTTDNPLDVAINGTGFFQVTRADGSDVAYTRNGQFTLMDAGPIQVQESDALLAAMRPYFEEDGITLHPYQPGQWLACSSLFKGLPSASLSRVMGLPVEPWLLGAHLPTLSPAIQTLRRLQNEMQMLLYSHPVNETRPRPINSIWIEGCGHLGDDTPAPPSPSPEVVVIDDLREYWLLRDATGWANAWTRLDAEVLPTLLQPVGARIAWCGQRQARWWCHQAPGAWSRLLRLFRPVTPAEVLACDA